MYDITYAGKSENTKIPLKIAILVLTVLPTGKMILMATLVLLIQW